MQDLLILETEHSTIEQAYGFRIPGYLIVQPKVVSTRLADLSRVQAADLFNCLAKAEDLIQELIRPERVYALRFGEENPQIHFHVIPRTAALEAAYLAQVLDGKPYSGARIVDWIWLNHESLGYTEEQIRNFVAAARRII